MWSWIHRLGSPKTAYHWSQRLQWLWISLSFLFLGLGTYASLFLAPPDYQQGDVFRIMYIHVPAAVLSLLIYLVMATNAFIFLVWKIKVCDYMAKCSAPLGALFTALTLVVGSLWGEPTWGTWWIWDARLTSELILFFIYLGVIALRSLAPNAQQGSQLTGIWILVGAINLPIIHYSVNWWHTLHQGATILRWGAPSIAPSMFYPLLLMLGGFLSFYLWMMSIALSTEILRREAKTQWVQRLMEVPHE